MSKVVDLQKYRDKIASSPNDNEILEEVVHDASKEMLVNAIWILTSKTWTLFKI